MWSAFNSHVLIALSIVQLAFVLSQLQPGPRSDMRECQWIGEAPFCGKPTCLFGWYQVDRNKHGDGRRCFTGKKVLCCENSVPAFTTTRTTTRRPHARPNVVTYPSPRPTPTMSPYRRPTPISVPTNVSTDNAYGPANGNGYGNDRWRGKNAVPIPITIEKPEDIRLIRPSPSPITPKPTAKLNSRKDDILALLKSIEAL